MTNALGYEELRLDAVLQAAKTMAGAAVTAPKSGGQLFLRGGKMFMETVIVHDPETRARMSAWLRARGKERRERGCRPAPARGQRTGASRSGSVMPTCVRP